jgi:hypothetical protein
VTAEAPPAHASPVARAALYAGGFIGPFGGGMVSVLLPELSDAFGVSTAAASLSVTFYFVPYAAIQLVSGTIGERFGRAQATRIAFVVYALGSLGAALAGSIGPFLVARALQGSANAFTSPLVLAGLADVTPREQLGRAVGTFAAVQTAGMVCAPLIGGLAGAIDYRLAFLAAALVALLLAIPRVPARRGRPADPPRLRAALTRGPGWLASAAFLAFLGLAGFVVVVAIYAGDEFGLGPEERGLLLAGFGVAGVIVGRARRRAGRPDRGPADGDLRLAGLRGDRPAARGGPDRRAARRAVGVGRHRLADALGGVEHAARERAVVEPRRRRVAGRRVQVRRQRAGSGRMAASVRRAAVVRVRRRGCSAALVSVAAWRAALA